MHEVYRCGVYVEWQDPTYGDGFRSVLEALHEVRMRVCQYPSIFYLPLPTSNASDSNRRRICSFPQVSMEEFYEWSSDVLAVVQEKTLSTVKTHNGFQIKKGGAAKKRALCVFWCAAFQWTHAQFVRVRQEKRQAAAIKGGWPS